MNRIILTIALFTLFIAPSLAWSPPYFCRNLDCPVYTSPSNDTNEFETRTYNGGTFVKTCITGRSIVGAQAVGFKRLWSYFNGANTRNMKISSTVPVLTRVSPNLANNRYTIYFFLPYALQDNPPQPNDKKVELIHYDGEFTVAVRSFDGYGMDLFDELQALQDILDQSNVDYNPHQWFSAFYDPLSRTKDRHNEVWLQLKSKPHNEPDVIQDKFQEVVQDIKEAVQEMPSPIDMIFKDIPN